MLIFWSFFFFYFPHGPALQVPATVGNKTKKFTESKVSLLEYLLESDEAGSSSAELRSCCLETAYCSINFEFSLKPY